MLSEIDLAILAERKNKDEEADEDSLFMKSLVPQLKRLDSQKHLLLNAKYNNFYFKLSLAQFSTAKRKLGGHQICNLSTFISNVL